MKSRWPVLAIVIAIACGYVWGPRRTHDLVRDPIAQDRRAWPLDHFWTWSVRMPDLRPGETVRLCVYARAVPVDENGNIKNMAGPIETTFLTSIQSEASAHAGEIDATEGFGWTRDMPVGVALQLIDFPPGAPATQPDQSVWLIGSLSRGGLTTNLVHVNRLPLHGKVHGFQTQTDTDWAGDDLPLLRFWVKDDAKAFQFDVGLVRQRPSRGGTDEKD